MRFFESLDKDNVNDEELNEITSRLSKIEPLWDEFNEVQSKIEDLDASEDGDLQREQFDESYFKLIGQIKALIKHVENLSDVASNAPSVVRSVASSGSNNNNAVNNLVKLPAIKLPTFDGQYHNWLEFRDSFLALVDGNEHLSDIQKFYYLKTSLDKDVLDTIKFIEVTADNYRSAWRFLVERYENKRLIVFNHIQAIIEHASISRENHKELRNLYDNVMKHLRSLKGLGQKTDEWDSIIIYVMSKKFDPVTRRDWETFKYNGDLPTMDDLHLFLRKKCEVLEKLELVRTDAKQSDKGKYHPATNKSNIECFYCKGPHSIFKCTPFLSLQINDRISAVRKLKLCLNCLRNNHPTWKCKLSKCKYCKLSHNGLLHLSRQEATIGETNPHPQAVLPTATTSGFTCASARTDSSQILLSTALVQVRNADNQYIIGRALLDSGSQSNFISERLCKRLKLVTSKINHSIKGVGQTLTNLSNKVDIHIQSNVNHFSIDLSCLVIPRITDKLPIISFEASNLNIPSELKLADPQFNISADVDLLLGAEAFWSIMVPELKTNKSQTVWLQKTELGWLVTGNLTSEVSNNTTISCLSLINRSSAKSIENKIEKFWQLEEIPNERVIQSEVDRYCESFFEATTRQDDSSQFIVNIPFKENVKQLGESREMALQRFMSLERKLAKNPTLRLEYVAFMKEYRDLNHMEECDDSLECDIGYYLPHHAVIKSSSITTKCRVVFDASAKTSTGISLNDTQLVGPKLQDDLFDILVRFRKHKLVMTGDVSKMYRRIWIAEDQRHYQKILWRFEATDCIKCYKLKTVTYGTASAPYLAVRCLIEAANKYEKSFPDACNIIKRDFYIDDLLTGAESAADLLKIQSQVSDILRSVGFPLRKWLCNDKKVLANFKTYGETEASILEIGEDEQNKTLGVFWNSCNDLIQYRVDFEILSNCRITKRGVLSTICQIFDPLGLVSCIIIVAKLMIQQMWIRKLEWDDELPNDLRDNWIRFREDLKCITELSIPRRAVLSEYIRIEIHGFSDASEKAYAACVYIRFSTRVPVSNLICAKSRVAPVKQVSLPRLELCGAVLVANLISKTIKVIEIKFDQGYLWTDSTITLAWIRGDSKRWKTFVANRVSEIQSLTKVIDWRHINSEDNPADLLSRGITVKSLQDCSLWWHGPPFFELNERYWDTQNVELNFRSEIPEQRSTLSLVSCIEKNDFLTLIEKFSSLNKIVKVTCFVNRFVFNCRKGERKFGVFTPIELEKSLNYLIALVQETCFSVEYKALLCKKELNGKGKLLSLRPFLDNGVMRVGGRLRNAKQQFDKRHPIILPKGHALTDLILRDYHEKLLHCGVQMLLCAVRDKYWPIAGRNSCKKIVRSCVKCFKASPKIANYLMGDLPKVRVNTYLPFQNVGTDYGGPFYVKDRKSRGARLNKVYICLFICMSVKAVHIELVSDLTTDAFLAAFNRFSSRRGKPSHVYSDNGTNFLGANNELNDLFNFLEQNSEKIGEQLAHERVHWHFIPARSPSFGGLWEAGIKSVKHHFKRVIGTQHLTFEEISTVLTQIESILNSRPLCPLTEDPEDAAALTPAHFLIGRQLTALPELDVSQVAVNRLNTWQQLQAMTQHYWKRWSKEYLAELQTRTKWKRDGGRLLEIGSLVLLKEENTPTLDWRLGRVVRLFPGQDGIVRVCEIKVRGTIVKRAINRLCILPVETHNNF
nr:unnamed protein product [Callosobruchus analis]